MIIEYPDSSMLLLQQDAEGEVDVSDQQRVLHTTPTSSLETWARKVMWFLRFILPATYILFIAIYWGVQSH